MKKNDFLALLSEAKEDEYGRLYVKGEYDNKVYFGVMTTVCEDLFVLNHSEENRNTDELYDRHFWDDDTFEAHVISSHDLSDLAKETMGLKVKEVKKQMKKKIKDLTIEEVEKICDKLNCCDNCPLDIPSCQICMKDIVNKGFLEKEIEVEE